MTAVGRFSTRPLYLQVKDMLVQRIAAGAWKPGAAIPNEIELSRELGISVGTVRKALDEMESERLDLPPPGPRHLRDRPDIHRASPAVQQHP